MIVVMVLSLLVQQTLTSRFKKYSKVGIGLSGAEVSARMMADNGINDVRIGSVNGQLTDHYNPTDKTINLSDSVYAQRNIAAAAVAAHETGHCLQHAQGYAPLKFRSAMVPVVSFANNTVQWVLLAGVIFINVFPGLLWIGIALFAGISGLMAAYYFNMAAGATIVVIAAALFFVSLCCKRYFVR